MGFDDLDRSVWASILLNNMIKKLNERMWDDIHADKHVAVVVDGQVVGEFIPHDGLIRVEIDGLQVADVDASPGRYGS
jgi:hypothetical protein